MNTIGGKKWARVAVCAAALVTPLAVSGCQSSTSASGTPGPAAGQTGTTSAANGGSSSASASTSATSATSTALNGTSGTGLTVSDGSSKILMNGQAVDFGTEVHDPSWSADGKRVLFIDGDGNLTVADADGSGKTVIAKNPGGEKWSHPTWEMVASDTTDQIPARAAYVFASATKAGTTTLWEITADPQTGQPNAQPQKLPLSSLAGPDSKPIPQSGNKWPSASGKQGESVYEYDHGLTSDLYYRDDNLREQTSLSITNGSEPDYVVTGTSAGSGWVTEVVFVRKAGGHKHIFMESMQDTQNAVAIDLTPKATTDCTEPALSPDGKTVAFSTAAGVQTAPADGSGTMTKVTDVPGFPAYRAGS
ncbi:PD40 domain-containing protein [Catenulispora sp. NF23]|uniref:PD40 domain-containing protein n=1 Tax=Catenulispora pinistramenti TaxID=2705254 RepID=A0ABS5L1Z6_9ACTN|nr:PD40 domain-containing protein [Catenulispora pinistramenti]MBS2533057.1 PD40 domain-containing protein [Catenulispora pinistramenti]MBS2552356.1 PD40 domain-containing protein [Catenulispora pinistramenti]